ncbi:MAG: ABC transporter ATP-binding protein [Pirellulales bacterium]
MSSTTTAAAVEPRSQKTSPTILRAENLSRTYADGHVTALDNVSLEVHAGEYLAIMGRSGSGKSTLLNLLGALDRPDRGEIYFEGEPLSKQRNLDSFRAQRIGFVFQSFYLLPTLTAVENVQIPMFEGPLGPAERAGRARELLRIVNLEHRVDHLPMELSVGERQRVAIARALANEPAMLLADEPTGNLDSTNEAEVLDLFDRLHRERNVTLVVITHSQDVADRAQRTIHLRDGRIVSDVVGHHTPHSSRS